MRRAGFTRVKTMDDMTPRTHSPNPLPGFHDDTAEDLGRYQRALARLNAASGACTDGCRPAEVEGPMGIPITLATLPPPDTRRWVVRRKAEVLAAIKGGLLTAAEACARYRLSPEELELWQASIDRAGIPGLRVTRIQLYRDYPAPRGYGREQTVERSETVAAWAR